MDLINQYLQTYTALNSTHSPQERDSLFNVVANLEAQLRQSGIDPQQVLNQYRQQQAVMQQPMHQPMMQPMMQQPMQPGMRPSSQQLPPGSTLGGQGYGFGNNMAVQQPQNAVQPTSNAARNNRYNRVAEAVVPPPTEQQVPVTNTAPVVDNTNVKKLSGSRVTPILDPGLKAKEIIYNNEMFYKYEGGEIMDDIETTGADDVTVSDITVVKTNLGTDIYASLKKHLDEYGPDINNSDVVYADVDNIISIYVPEACGYTQAINSVSELVKCLRTNKGGVYRYLITEVTISKEL